MNIYMRMKVADNDFISFCDKFWSCSSSLSQNYFCVVTIAEKKLNKIWNVVKVFLPLQCQSDKTTS